MPDDAPRPDMVEYRRRQRMRNVVMLIVLVGIAALFYAIAMVRFRVS